jgi:hypothetical protein
MIKKIVKNHINCKKCGVELIEKNSRLSTYDKDSGLYFVRSACNHCARKATFCTFKYEDPQLEKIAAKQAKILHNKSYYKRILKPKKEAVKIPYVEPTECKQCGVELCDKNELYIVSEVNHKSAKCNACTHKCRSCKVIYPNKKLQELSKIKNKQLNLKLNKVRNPEVYKEALKATFTKNKDKYAAIQKVYANKQRTELGDTYVKQRITSSFRLGVKEITPQLIEVKRKQLELIRTIKQIEYEQSKHKTNQRCC